MILQSGLYVAYTFKGSNTLYFNHLKETWQRYISASCISDEETLIFFIEGQKPLYKKIYIQEIGFDAGRFMQGSYTLNESDSYDPLKSNS